MFPAPPVMGCPATVVSPVSAAFNQAKFFGTETYTPNPLPPQMAVPPPVVAVPVDVTPASE